MPIQNPTRDEVDALVTAARENGGIAADHCAQLIEAAALRSGCSTRDAARLLHERASTRPDLLQLPPAEAIEAQLRLLTALARVADASLWLERAPGRLELLTAVGGGAETRSFRVRAALALDGDNAAQLNGRTRVHAVPVRRFGDPVAALVVRTGSHGTARSDGFLDRCAAALAPVLEREALLARTAQHDQELHAASERRLLRLGFDLHDGPLQELAALGVDLQLARKQVAGALTGDLRPLVLGRFDDLTARLHEIDRSLRELAHSLESSNVVDRSLPESLGREIASFDRRVGIETRYSVSGAFDDLSASQRIAFFRIAQEALTNVREHTDATAVSVSLERLPGRTQLVVEDNGAGFDVAPTVELAARRGRLGLVGMNERVRLLGGTFTLRSTPGKGTRLRVALPDWQPVAS